MFETRWGQSPTNVTRKQYKRGRMEENEILFWCTQTKEEGTRINRNFAESLGSSDYARWGWGFLFWWAVEEENEVGWAITQSNNYPPTQSLHRSTLRNVSLDFSQQSNWLGTEMTLVYDRTWHSNGKWGVFISRLSTSTTQLIRNSFHSGPLFSNSYTHSHSDCDVYVLVW